MGRICFMGTGNFAATIDTHVMGSKSHKNSTWDGLDHQTRLAALNQSKGPTQIRRLSRFAVAESDVNLILDSESGT
jgi:hypothetical protein